jgi:hypothetical protein
MKGMPEHFLLFLSLSFACFLAGIVFFRKDNVPLNKVLISFMLSIYNPFRLKMELKSKGIALIVLGYLTFAVYMAIVM